MLDLTKIELTAEQIIKSETALLIDVRESFAYVDGKRTDKVDGVVYEIVLTANGYDKLNVRSQEIASSITKEMLAKGGIWVKPMGFTAKIYRSNNDYKISAKCQKMEVVQTAQK